jgi:hypothetical protein
VDLSEEQNRILLAIVAGHWASQGQEFTFEPAESGGQLDYSHARRVDISGNREDFVELAKARLIITRSNPQGMICGGPTQDGITRAAEIGGDCQRQMEAKFATLQGRLTITKTLKGAYYDTGLLAASRRDHLEKIVRDGETKLRKLLVCADLHFRGCQLIEREFDCKTAREGVRVLTFAEQFATQGALQFADGLLASQARLVAHKEMVRSSTTRLAGEIRNALRTMTSLAPLLPWRKDPIVQHAITACEDRIPEAYAQEGILEPKPFLDAGTGHRTWPPLVQAWEALRAETSRYSLGARAPA